MFMPDCSACGEPLNTKKKHDWCCDNEDCSNYGQSDNDMYDQLQECHKCGGFAGWSGGLWRCDDCNHKWA
jgi:hypothetical protein